MLLVEETIILQGKLYPVLMYNNLFKFFSVQSGRTDCLQHNDITAKLAAK